MGLGQKFLTLVRSIFCCSGRVSHLWFGFGKFSLILFTAGQKYAQVGSGPISTDDPFFTFYKVRLANFFIKGTRTEAGKICCALENPESKFA